MGDDVGGLAEPGARARALDRLPIGLGHLRAERAAEAGRVQAQEYGVHPVATLPVVPWPVTLRRRVASRAVAAIRWASAARVARPEVVRV